MKGVLEYRKADGYMTTVYYNNEDGLKVLSELQKQFRALVVSGQALEDMAGIRVYDCSEDHTTIVFNRRYYSDYEWVDFNSFTDRKIRGAA